MSDLQQRFEQLNDLLQQRIVFLDGAMGTMIQGYDLAEADYRGDRFTDSARSAGYQCHHAVKSYFHDEKPSQPSSRLLAKHE